jgi:hypothetical protein
MARLNINSEIEKERLKMMGSSIDVKRVELDMQTTPIETLLTLIE